MSFMSQIRHLCYLLETQIFLAVDVLLIKDLSELICK